MVEAKDIHNKLISKLGRLKFVFKNFVGLRSKRRSCCKSSLNNIELG